MGLKKGFTPSETSSGFSLVELLAVLIIIGILASFAVASLLGQIWKAKETEAIAYVANAMLAQQVYFFGALRFQEDINLLDTGLAPEEYTIQMTISESIQQAEFCATPTENPFLKDVYGRVYLSGYGGETITEFNTVDIREDGPRRQPC